MPNRCSINTHYISLCQAYFRSKWQCLQNCKYRQVRSEQGWETVLMQAFVDAEGDCEERGISRLPAREVHKIAVLDMRLGNCDRNGGGARICTPKDASPSSGSSV